MSKLKTIDDLCGTPGGFQRSLDQEREMWARINADRSERIRKAASEKREQQARQAGRDAAKNLIKRIP